jgi:hypothetical protein
VSYLRNLIETGGYNKQEVFNVGMVRFYWKCMPQHTYIMKEEKQPLVLRLQKIN